MNWIKIVIAAMFEVGWVVGLTHASSVIEWILTAIAIVLSFYLLINASKSLPVGTAYAVFVGLGTTGVTIFDVLVFAWFEYWKSDSNFYFITWRNWIEVGYNK